MRHLDRQESHTWMLLFTGKACNSVSGSLCHNYGTYCLDAKHAGHHFESIT